MVCRKWSDVLLAYGTEALEVEKRRKEQELRMEELRKQEDARKEILRQQEEVRKEMMRQQEEQRQILRNIELQRLAAKQVSTLPICNYVSQRKVKRRNGE